MQYSELMIKKNTKQSKPKNISLVSLTSMVVNLGSIKVCKANV